MATHYPSNTTYQFPNGPRNQPSPEDSASNTPSNVSPTSPRMQEYMRHLPSNYVGIRPMKQPLYVPAVLRPTERYPKQGPLTPPKSLHGSLDSLQNAAEEASEGPRTPLESAIENEMFVEAEELGDVTGPPKRDHWKPDAASPTCDSPKCRSSFSLVVRRHHCRHCGHIFCSDHTAYSVPLNQEARFHPDGIPSRACDTCARQFEKWDTARSIRRKDSGGSVPATPIAGLSGGSTPRAVSFAGHGQPKEALVASVPKDWTWSTF